MPSRAAVAPKHPALLRASRLPHARSRSLPVPHAFAGLLPDGLTRGTTTLVGGLGSTSLALALVAQASEEGAWTVAVGLPSLGPLAALEAGVALDRLVLVPHPGEAWATVLASCIEAFDVVLVQPPSRARTADVRRLEARNREGGSVLVALRRWPGSHDLRVHGTSAAWSGTEDGHGHLRARRLELEVDGRRVQRPMGASLWLPDRDGEVRVAQTREQRAAVVG
jgi:hypothetical protein